MEIYRKDRVIDLRGDDELREYCAEPCGEVGYVTRCPAIVDELLCEVRKGLEFCVYKLFSRCGLFSCLRISLHIAKLTH